MAEPELGAPCPSTTTETTLPGRVTNVGKWRFCVPVGSRKPVVTALRSGKGWESRTHQLIEQYLNAVPESSSTDAVVTAGLFVGDFLPHLATLLAARGGNVYGLEPSPQNFAFAKGTIFENKLSNAFIKNAALGPCSDLGGTLADGNSIEFCVQVRDGSPMWWPFRIWQQTRPCGGQCGFDNRHDCTQYMSVPVVCLDRFVAREGSRVRVLHLDVEGAELLAIKGAVRILRQDRPLVILESADAETVEFLTGFGYATATPILVDTNQAFYHGSAPIGH